MPTDPSLRPISSESIVKLPPPPDAAEAPVGPLPAPSLSGMLHRELGHVIAVTIDVWWSTCDTVPVHVRHA